MRARFVTSLIRPQTTRKFATWAHVPEGPPDPILGLSVAFQQDKDPRKVNLGVGAYRDDNNKPVVLECVRQAEARLVGKTDHEYAPIAGVAAFNKAAGELLFGNDSAALKEDRVSTMQALSGTGALRVAAAFLARYYPSKEIYMPDPTWGNHGPIFRDSGLVPKTYRYYRPSDCGLDIDGLLADLRAAPAKSIVLLHACAHNPTGVDPTPEEWQRILEVVREKGHYTFFDAAYQGFASGDPARDAQAVRLWIKQSEPLILAQSFAKNFGLYGERAGAMHLVCNDAEEKKRAESQLKILIRPMYSNPPVHGARLVAEVLNDKALAALWAKEVKGMADRIVTMRTQLTGALSRAGSKRNWSHIEKQIGMFSYTGLSKEQCEKLIKDYHIYLTSNGRISMAGLTSKNVDYVANAIHDVTK